MANIRIRCRMHRYLIALLALVLGGTAHAQYPSPQFSAINGWTVAVSVAPGSDTPAAGGTGNAVHDVLTLNDGCATHAQVIVTSVTSGAVTGYSVKNAGSCATAPTNPVAVSSTTGSGSGATFTLAWRPQPLSSRLTPPTFPGLFSNNAIGSALELRQPFRFGVEIDPYAAWTDVNYINTVMNYTGATTTNGVQPLQIQLYLNGTGGTNQETNVLHTYVAYAAGVTMTGAGEIHEASADIYGTVNELDANLAMMRVRPSGTSANLIGYKSWYYNENTTAASVGVYKGFDCEPNNGAGTNAQFFHCLYNNDPKEQITTKGHLSFPPSTAPTISGCGTGATISGRASDTMGLVTLGTTPTTCTVTFFTRMDENTGNVGYCAIIPQDGGVVTLVTALPTSCAFTVSSGTKFLWMAFGNS